MSARPVYSQRFFAGASLTPVGSVGPLVPAGVVWVVRDVDAVVRGSTTASLGILGQTSGQLLQFWTYASGTAQSPNFEWRGRQVFAVGEQVGLTVLSGTWDVSISGYQLTLP